MADCQPDALYCKPRTRLQGQSRLLVDDSTQQAGLHNNPMETGRHPLHPGSKFILPITCRLHWLTFRKVTGQHPPFHYGLHPRRGNAACPRGPVCWAFLTILSFEMRVLGNRHRFVASPSITSTLDPFAALSYPVARCDVVHSNRIVPDHRQYQWPVCSRCPMGLGEWKSRLLTYFKSLLPSQDGAFADSLVLAVDC